MSQMYFDVWAADDMNGTALGHLSDATDKHIRVAFNQLGNGQFNINRHSSQAAWCAPDNLIRVRLEAGGPFAYDDARYKFAFLIEEGAETLLSNDEDGGEDATLGGRDATVILDRAIIWPSANYLPGDPNGNDIYWTRALKDGVVRITTALNGGERNAGTVLRIFIRDAEARSPNPLTPLNDDFNFQLDSNGDNWTENGSEWEFPVGTSLLDLLATLVGSGLYYSVTPDLILHAYNSDPSNDLSATIDFTEGDNIREIADRQVHAPPAKSRVIVKGTSTTDQLKYREVVDSSAESDLGRREGFIEYEATPTNERLDLAGQKYINAQLLKHDGPTSLGALDTAGREALIDYFPGDTVTVNITGVYTALELAISAIALNDTESGEYDPVIEFRDDPWEGQSFDPIGRPTSDAPSGGGCRDCPPLEPYVPDPTVIVNTCQEVEATAAQTFLPNNGTTSLAPGHVHYDQAGGANPPIVPTVGFAGSVGFPDFGAGGSPDRIGDCTGTVVRVIVYGAGVLTINTAADTTTRTLSAALKHRSGISDVTDDGISGVSPGTPIVLTVDTHGQTFCTHYVDVTDTAGACGGKWTFVNAVWEPTTTTVVTPPIPGQRGNEGIPGTTADTTYTTNYPYQAGTLDVVVICGSSSTVVIPTEVDPDAGTFTLPVDATGCEVVVRYIIASSTGTGEENPPPTSGPIIIGTTDHPDLTGRDEPAQHPADAITVADAGGYFAGTDVEAILQEIGAGTTPAEPVAVIPATGAAETLDYDTARYWDLTLDANCTLTISNPPASETWGQLVIVLRQGTGAPYTVTWPASVQWPDTDGTAGGSAPTLFTAEDAIDVVTLVTVDGGATWGGTHGGGSVGALDDLSDVTITSPADHHTLRYDGAAWVNDDTRWEPVTFNFGSGPELVWDGDDLVMEWKAY